MFEDRSSRSAWRACLAVMLLALLVRAHQCSQLACISRDGVHFVTFAKQLADDPITWMKATTKQPGFAALLLGAHGAIGPLLGGDTPMAWQRCGQAMALFGGVGACGLAYLLTRRLYDPTAALVAGVLAAFWWQGAQLSADVLSDMPHLAVYLIALLIGYAALASGKMWRLAACGAVAGLAYLLRQEALGLVVAVGICRLWPSPGRRRRTQLLGVAVLALSFAAVVAPHAIAVGKLMPNKGLHDLIHAMSDAQRASPDPGPSLLLAHIIPWWQAPGRMAEAWCKSGRYAISLLALLGLFLKSAPRAEGTGRRLVLTAVLLQIVLVQLRVAGYGEISSRYMVIPLALSVPWAATGLIALLKQIVRRLPSIGRTGTAVVWIIGMALPLAPQVFYLARAINHDREQFCAAGRWLRDHAAPDEVVLAHERLGQVMFYAGRTDPEKTWLRMSETASVDEARRRIERFSPAWFVDVEASRREKGDESAFFRSLHDGGIPQLRRAWSAGPVGRRAVVFRVVKARPAATSD